MITVIAGTNRAGSRSLALARHLVSVYEDEGVEARLLDLRELPRELFSPDAYRSKPAAFAEAFVKPVLASEGLHCVVPEYNGSFPGALKLFIDMLPHPEAIERRPVAYTGLSAGQFGALRAVEHLQQALGYRNAFNYPERVFLPRAYAEFDDDDRLQNEALGRRLRQQALGFAKFVEAVATVRSQVPI